MCTSRNYKRNLKETSQKSRNKWNTTHARTPVRTLTFLVCRGPGFSSTIFLFSSLFIVRLFGPGFLFIPWSSSASSPSDCCAGLSSFSIHVDDTVSSLRYRRFGFGVRFDTRSLIGVDVFLNRSFFTRINFVPGGAGVPILPCDFLLAELLRLMRLSIWPNCTEHFRRLADFGIRIFRFCFLEIILRFVWLLSVGFGQSVTYMHAMQKFDGRWTECNGIIFRVLLWQKVDVGATTLDSRALFSHLLFAIVSIIFWYHKHYTDVPGDFMVDLVVFSMSYSDEITLKL